MPHPATIQTRDAYGTLVREGSLRGDPELADPWFTEAYAWMGTVMDERLPTVGPGVLWFWARTRRRDLVRCARASRGSVLLTVPLSRERVLLSDFEAWHYPLNRWLDVPRLPGDSAEAWEARADRVGDEWDERTEHLRDEPIDRWPADLRVELEQSWQVVFDRWREAGSRCVQATAHHLDAREVVRAVRIGP